MILFRSGLRKDLGFFSSQRRRVVTSHAHRARSALEGAGARGSGEHVFQVPEEERIGLSSL